MYFSLKQICGDLFQDICLFSDVCSLLGSINYRIHARQLIQDLFLEAPFYEVIFYDENTRCIDIRRLILICISVIRRTVKFNE